MFRRVFCVVLIVSAGRVGSAAEMTLVRKTGGSISNIAMVDGGHFVLEKGEASPERNRIESKPMMVALESQILVVNDHFLNDIGVDIPITDVGTIRGFGTPPFLPVHPGNEVAIDVSLEVSPGSTTQAILSVDLVSEAVKALLRADSPAFQNIVSPRLTLLDAERPVALSKDDGVPLILTGLVHPAAMTEQPILFFGETGIGLEVVPQITAETSNIALAVIPSVRYFQRANLAQEGFEYIAPLSIPLPPGVPPESRSLGSTVHFSRDGMGALQLAQSRLRKLCSTPMKLDYPGAPEAEPQVNLLSLYEQQHFSWNSALGAGLIQHGTNSRQAAFLTIGGLAGQSGPASAVDLTEDSVVDQRDLKSFTGCMLGRLPVIGNCFKGDRNGDGRSTPRDADQLLIFLTPHLTASEDEPRPQALDPALKNYPYGALVIAQGDPLPGDPSDTVAGFFAIRANGAGVGVIGVYVSDGSSAVLLIDEDGMNVVLRTGQDYGDSAVTSILEVSNVTPQGYFAVSGTLQAGGRAVYRIGANSAANGVRTDWRNY